jgi:hypothetical protein
MNFESIDSKVDYLWIDYSKRIEYPPIPIENYKMWFEIITDYFIALQT